MPETYETVAKGIRIFPGQWRPNYPFEQIAWISPPWPTQDYVWLDFPEAIFSKQRLLYLSHVDPSYFSLYPNLPKVEWDRLVDGLSFSRDLPNGIRFGGSIIKKSVSTVELELYIKNGSSQPLTDIKRIQTCMYLRAIREFSDFTNENKFIHTPDSGWISLSEAFTMQGQNGHYKVGLVNEQNLADLPIIATVSNQAQRLVAMTWHKDTHCLWGNKYHPCMHSDPQFNDLASGEGASIHGEIVFLEGTLDELKVFLQNKMQT